MYKFDTVVQVLYFSCCFLSKCSSKIHCVKSVRIWSYLGRYFPAFGLNTDQNNSITTTDTFYAVVVATFFEVFSKAIQ